MKCLCNALKKNNIEIIISDEADESIQELFVTLKNRDQNLFRIYKR